MICRKLAFPSGAQKSVLRGTFGIKPRARFADEKAGFYDRDARDYFARSGLTQSRGKQEISAFIKGVKGLGLWSQMICWPLRSRHNAGSGSTAYSLGGLSTAIGTIAGADWSDNGLVFGGPGSDDMVTTGYTTVHQSLTAMVSASPSGSLSGNSYVIFSQDDNTLGQRSWQIGLKRQTELDPIYYQGVAWHTVSQEEATHTATGPSAGQARMHILRFGGASTWHYRLMTATANNGATTPGTLAGTGSTIRIGSIGAGNVSNFEGTIHAAIFLSSGTTTSAQNNFYALYKSTLGQGLGLP